MKEFAAGKFFSFFSFFYILFSIFSFPKSWHSWSIFLIYIIKCKNGGDEDIEHKEENSLNLAIDAGLDCMQQSHSHVKRMAGY